MAGKDMTLRMVMKLAANDFTRGISGIQKQLQGLGNYLKTAFAVGSVATFGREMIKWTKEFEDAMARAKAVSNAPAEGFRMMRDEALRLGASTRYTSVEVAQTLEVLTRNGMSATNATRALADVLKLAQANAVELADAGNMITNTLNMFGLSIEKAAYVTDILSATASSSATDLTSLYEAMTNAAPMAHALGIDIEEVASALGALANVGVKGPDAGTQLRQFLQRLTDPLAMKKMQKLTGFSFDEDFIKTEGLEGVLKKLQSLNLSVSQLNEIFTVRSSKSIIQLMNSMDNFVSLLGTMENAAGTASRMFVEGVGSMRYELDILKSMWQNFLIAIGDKSEGPFIGLVKFAQNFITSLRSVGGVIGQIGVLVLVFRNRIAGFFKSMVAGAMAWARQTQIAEGIVRSERIKTSLEEKASVAGLSAAEKKYLKDRIAARKTIIASYKAEQKAAQALKATIASIGWAAAIIAIEVLITKLVAMNAEIRQAKKSVEESQKAQDNLISKTNMLLNMIGNGSDKDSLNGAVNEAKRTFSEFADAIQLAADEAGKTGNYEKLKMLLKDIASLQTKIMASKANQELVDATSDKFANKVRKSQTGKKIENELKAKGYTDDTIQSIFKYIGDTIIRNNKDLEKAVSEVGVFLNSLNISLKNISANKLVKETATSKRRDVPIFGPQTSSDYTYRNAVNAYNDQQKLTNDVAKEENQIKWQNAIDEFYRASTEAITTFKAGSKEYEEAMTQAFQNLKNAVGGIMNQLPASIQNEYEKLKDKYGGKGPSSGTGGEGGSGSKKKTPQDKFNDIIQDYIDDSKKVEEQYKNGILTQQQYAKALSDVELEALKAIGGVADLDKMLNGLPESSKQAGNSLAGMLKDFNQKAVENILLDFDQKRAELNTSYENGPKDAESLKTYNDAMDDLAASTTDELNKIKDLNDIVDKLNPRLKDLYDLLDFARTAKRDTNITQQSRNLDENTKTDVKEPELKVKLSKDDKSVEGLKQALQRELDKEHFDLNFDIANDETLLDNVNARIKDVDGNIKYLEEQLRKFEAGEDNDIDFVKDEAVKKLEELKAQLILLMKLSKDLQTKLDISKIILETDKSIDNLTDKAIDSISSLSSAFDKLKDSVKDIAEAFDLDVEFEGLEKGITVVNAIIQAIESLKTIMETFQAFQKMVNDRQIRQNAEVALSNAAVAASEGIKASAVATGATVNAVETATSEASTAANKKRAKSNLMVATTETVKAGASGSAAAAEGAESVAKIPYIGAALAVAAAAAIAGALVAAFSKIKGFAHGGIIPGTKWSGDQNLIRADSGEMMLTRGNQATLWRAIQSGNFGGGGKVEFVIKGDQLVGALANHRRIHR